MLKRVDDLWTSTDQADWVAALERYWQFVKPENEALELSLDSLQLDRIATMNPRTWYEFLETEYFVWKYTAKNRLATTRQQLQRYLVGSDLESLDLIRRRLLAFDTSSVRLGLSIATKIRGLGVAGASGLLALMYPNKFATVDQFLVKGLRQVGGLPEAAALVRMNPERLTLRDGVLLITLLRRKSEALNQLFAVTSWTPRALDKILWTYGR